MKQIYKIVLIILAIIISHRAFPQNENSKGCINFEQEIELSKGYSLISSRILPENTDIQNILQNNLNNLEFVRNSQGLMLKKIGSVWVNNIGDWVNAEGYLFKMNQDDELIIVGETIEPQTAIELSKGYQIIGYLPDQSLNTVDVFQDVLENLVYVRNSQGSMLKKIGPVWVNNIGDMQPGEAYLVKMSLEDILIYPSTFICGNPFTDLRDGHIYNTVQIGDTTFMGMQCWMVENLDIGEIIIGDTNQTDNGVIEKFCYNDNYENCITYGGMYQWDEMMQYTTLGPKQGICPTGWHLPTITEWENLIDYYNSNAGGIMKEAGTTHWNSPNTGATNSSGITALPGGKRDINGIFSDMGYRLFFWATTEWSHGAAGKMLYYNSGNVGFFLGNTASAYSVRCLKNSINQPPEPPSSPIPADGSENQSIEYNVSWTCTDPEGDTLTYDIYFGIAVSPPLVATGRIETTYNPGILEINTEYFWKIVVHDNFYNTTEGTVWSFITQTEIPQPCPGIPMVAYEGQVYNTVLIGEQCWLKENLNVGIMINSPEDMTDNGVIERYCYDNNPTNCDEYGGLYQWDEMMQYVNDTAAQGICPERWHIPTDDDWKLLEGTVDSQYPVGDTIWNNAGVRGFDAGLKLKSTSSWSGNDIFGFSIIPGGFSDYTGSFYALANCASFWSSNEYYNSAWFRIFRATYNGVNRNRFYKAYSVSVRCVMD